MWVNVDINCSPEIFFQTFSRLWNDPFCVSGTQNFNSINHSVNTFRTFSFHLHIQVEWINVPRPEFFFEDANCRDFRTVLADFHCACPSNAKKHVKCKVSFTYDIFGRCFRFVYIYACIAVFLCRCRFSASKDFIYSVRRADVCLAYCSCHCSIHKYLPTISDCLRAGAVTCLGRGSSKAAAPKRKSWVRRCAGGQLERCVHDSDVNEWR